MTPAVLEARAVIFGYGKGAPSLDGVSLRANRGEVVVVLAANGGGKTTLVKVLAGLLRPQHGDVRLHGDDIFGFTDQQRFRRVGVVFQEPNEQLFAGTVAEDVAFGPANMGLCRGEIDARVAEGLALVRGEALLHRAIHTLSHGEQKRVALAGVLAMRPEVLLLDEPSAGLDAAGERLLVSLIERLRADSGMTVVLTTHDVDLFAALADRVCVLDRGRVALCGGGAEVFADGARLEALGLRLPRLAELADRLRSDGHLVLERLPLSLAEANALLLAMLRGERGAP